MGREILRAVSKRCSQLKTMNITRELHILRTYHSQDKAFSIVTTAEEEDFFAPLLQQRRRYFLISRPSTHASNFNLHKKIVSVPTFVTIERLIQLKSKEKSSLFIYSGQISLPPFWNSFGWWSSSLRTANKLPPSLTARPTDLRNVCVCTHFSRLVRNLCVRRRVRPAAVCSAGYIAISCPGAKGSEEGRRNKKLLEESDHTELWHTWFFRIITEKMFNKK